MRPSQTSFSNISGSIESYLNFGYLSPRRSTTLNSHPSKCDTDTVSVTERVETIGSAARPGLVESSGGVDSGEPIEEVSGTVAIYSDPEDGQSSGANRPKVRTAATTYNDESSLTERPRDSRRLCLRSDPEKVTLFDNPL